MEAQKTLDTFKDSIVNFLNDFFGAFNPTILDAIMVAVLLISAILAFARGFTRETLSLITWVGSFVAALYIHSYLLPYVTAYTGLNDSTALRFGLGGVIFVIFFVALWIVSIKLSSVIKATSVSNLDRGLGFLFGIFRGFVIACLIFAAYQQTQKNNRTMPDYITDSIFYPTLSWGAKTAIEVLPDWANHLKSETLIQRQISLISQQKNTLDNQVEDTIENQIDKANQTSKDAVSTIIQK